MTVYNIHTPWQQIEMKPRERERDDIKNFERRLNNNNNKKRCAKQMDI